MIIVCCMVERVVLKCCYMFNVGSLFANVVMRHFGKALLLLEMFNKKKTKGSPERTPDVCKDFTFVRSDKKVIIFIYL